MPPTQESGIQWDKVTWYSKILAVFLFFAVVFGIFFFGVWYEKQLLAQPEANTLQNIPVTKNQDTTKNVNVITNENYATTTPLLIPISSSTPHYKEEGDQINYLGVPIQGADAATFLVSAIDSAYAKDKNDFYYGGNIFPNVDKTTFVVLGRSSTYGLCEFAKDKNYLYNEGKVIGTEADLASLEFILDKNGNFTGYAKDRNTLYYSSCDDDVSLVPVIGADPKTFSVIAGLGGFMDDLLSEMETPPTPLFPFGKDDQHVYVGTTTVTGSDGATFMRISPTFMTPGRENNYYKDKNMTYYYGLRSGFYPLPEVDTATFSVRGDLPYYSDKRWASEPDFDFSTDSTHMYFEGDLINNADSKTFVIMKDGEGVPTQYEKDKSNIYFLGIRVDNADYATFSIPNPYPSGEPFYNAQDKNNKYLNGNILN